MTIPKAWHLRDGVNGLFMRRQKKGVATIELLLSRNVMTKQCKYNEGQLQRRSKEETRK